MLKRRWNGQVHGKEFRGRLSPRGKVEDAERTEEMSGGGKGWQTALNSWTCSCAQIQNPNPPLPHAPRAQQFWGSNLSTHQGCAFRRAMRIKGEAGVAWCHLRLRPTLRGKLEQQKGLLLAEASAQPSNHSLVLLSGNMCWSNPFPMHSCFPSTFLQKLEVFCGSLLMGTVSWTSSHHSCLLSFSTKCSLCSHSTHTSSLYFLLGRWVWPR